MMYNFESNTGLFAVCIVLMLMTITKWYNLVHLDELPEYKRSVLEVMRQPLEDRIDLQVPIQAGSFSELQEAISYRELDKAHAVIVPLW